LREAEFSCRGRRSDIQ